MGSQIVFNILKSKNSADRLTKCYFTYSLRVRFCRHKAFGRIIKATILHYLTPIKTNIDRYFLLWRLRRWGIFSHHLHLEKSPPPAYSPPTKFLSPPPSPIKSQFPCPFPTKYQFSSWNSKTSFLVVVMLLYCFCFNSILFGHTGHAKFDFNWCSVFPESCF